MEKDEVWYGSSVVAGTTKEKIVGWGWGRIEKAVGLGRAFASRLFLHHSSYSQIFESRGKLPLLACCTYVP